ncbi:MAG: alpha-1,4-glucan--maltose-1-phosphate maltosyltransferase [Gemmatimonadota bacterium]|nr:alpha-1,4-glucan--maltose-1-phosphate maltosyltransferase [Gemmatimonadota bacterium]
MPPLKGRKSPAHDGAQGGAALAIECVTPSLDDGRHPVKRIIGDSFHLSADIFREGHDLVAARIRYRSPADREWRYVPLVYEYNNDRWGGGFPLDEIGRWVYTVEAWTDVFATWRSGLQKKIDAGQDVSLELLEGAEIVDAAANRARFGDIRNALKHAAATLRTTELDQRERMTVALAPQLIALVESYHLPADLTTYDRELEIVVDRERARFAAWYEMFPRSQGEGPGRHGTFATAESELERIAELGFDVVYLPPIHPIGATNRKGRNNSLEASASDPGSPWAIGGEAGGHTAVDPRLGTLADFDRFVTRAHKLGMEVALDYALQCSPDHPWLRDHPDWFFIRADGSIRYAENPPKKYQDIYPLNLWCADRAGLWNACRDIFLFWISYGVHTFRVDNPHTKPFAFWRWVIAEVKQRHPEVIFLSEAFTRPKRMKHLAKIGFTQSYTYFTWRTGASELAEYLTELTQSPMREYMKGNLFANTPDILHEFLQHGGRAGFRIRALLAATLSPLYGIYSGFELLESVPLRAGSEEYIDSEKYALKYRDWSQPDSIADDLGLLNRIRRENRALQLYDNLTFHPSDNDRILFYRKSAPNGQNDLLIAVNVDPHSVQESTVHVPIADLGIDPEDSYAVEDQLTGARYLWRGSRNYVRLDPREQVGHILRVVR